MAQQTAVEWLAIKLYEHMHMRGDGNVYNSLLEQANKMFEKQILDAICMNQNGLLRRKTVLEAKQYYNETYERKS